MREGPERHIAYLPSTLPSALHPLASSGKELIESNLYFFLLMSSEQTDLILGARKLSSGLKSSLPSAPMPSESTSSKIADEMFTKKFGELPQQSPLHIADAEFISNGEAYKGKLYVCHDFLCLFSHIGKYWNGMEEKVIFRPSNWSAHRWCSFLLRASSQRAWSSHSASKHCEHLSRRVYSSGVSSHSSRGGRFASLLRERCDAYQSWQ